VPYCSADCSALLILPLVNGFHNGLHAVLLCGWQHIAHYSARQRFSQRFSRRIAPRMAAYCSFFHSSTAFTTVWRSVAQRMASDCSFLHSSTAFTTVRAPYFSADGGAFLMLSLINGFHNGLRAVLLCKLQRIAHTSARHRLSQRLAHRIAQRMTADCSYFRSSKPFTTNCAPYCSAEGSALLVLQFVKGFHDGLRAVLLCGLQCISDTSARQRLSQRFTRRIAQRMTADCSFFHSSTGFTSICALYCTVNGSADGITAW